MAGLKQNWSVSDTNVLLETLRELKIVERLDGRKARNSDLFKKVHEKLEEAGIHRSIEQIKNRWKSLKASYYKAKTQNGKSGSDPASFQFYVPMDELMGDRPLSNISASGIDIGFEDDGTNTSEDLSTEATYDDCSIADDESSFDEAPGSSTQQIRTETEDSCPGTSEETRTSKKRPRASSSGYAKAMRTWTTDLQTFFQEMQQSQNKWIEEQQERRQQREERLLSRFIEESTISNERLVGKIFDGLRSIFTPIPPPPQGMTPVHPYPPQHFYPGQSGSARFPPHNLTSYNSDYNLHDLG